MVETGFSSFDTMVDKANRLLKDVEEAFEWPKERRKTIVRGVYYDGWKPAETPVKMSNEEFFARVRSEFPYAVEGGSEKLVRTVLKSLERHVSAGEWQHLKSRVPNSFAALLP